MPAFDIAVIAGDGVGVEVIPPAKRVLEEIGGRLQVQFNFQDFDWGSEHYFHHGRMMPADAIDRLRPFDAILLGAVGHPEIPDHVTLNGLLLPIRRAFDQYANVRPAVLYKGVQSPLALRKGEQIDFVVVRENTEGEYSQVGGSCTTISRKKSRSRRRCSRGAASSASCALLSNSRGGATGRSA